jgi:hypothetical protein
MVDDWREVADGLQRFLSGEWSTLLVAADWAQHHCVVPDGFRRGEWFENVDWQLWSLLNWYRVKPDAVFSEKPAEAFLYRRSQIVGPQKCGKAPYTAEHICIEGVGPAVFDGWASGGEVYDCREHGCGCGWVYEYQPGEAMGRCWPTPLIQITAFSEKQTDNIYSALRPMIDDGPLRELIPKTGEELIRLPGGGRIDVVTSEAQVAAGCSRDVRPPGRDGHLDGEREDARGRDDAAPRRGGHGRPGGGDDERLGPESGVGRAVDGGSGRAGRRHLPLAPAGEGLVVPQQGGAPKDPRVRLSRLPVGERDADRGGVRGDHDPGPCRG